MDAATIYANAMRAIDAAPGGKNRWRLINIVCFPEPDIDGNYFNEADYAALYKLAPNIKSAFEWAEEAFSAARSGLRQKLKQQKEKNTAV